MYVCLLDPAQLLDNNHEHYIISDQETVPTREEKLIILLLACVILQIAYPTLKTFFIVCPQSNVSGKSLCSCPGDARGQGNNPRYFRPLFFLFFSFSFFSAAHHLIVHSRALTNRARRSVS